MRTFYEQCGISKSTTEAAIKLRLAKPDKKASPLKDKPKRKKQAA
jgi:hypothetical protein